MHNHRIHKPLGLALASVLAAVSLSLVSTTYSDAASKRFYKGSVSQSVATADRLMMKGKYADAATYYQTALKRNPNDTNANIGYGMALAKQFKLDGADDQFNKALSRDSNNPGAHAGKALTMLNRLQSSSNTIRNSKDATLRDAQAEAQKAIDADKQIPEAHYVMGLIYKEQGKLNDAASEMKRAINLDPKFPDGYAGLGMIQLSQNNPSGAATEFQAGNQTQLWRLDGALWAGSSASQSRSNRCCVERIEHCGISISQQLAGSPCPGKSL